VDRRFVAAFDLGYGPNRRLRLVGERIDHAAAKLQLADPAHLYPGDSDRRTRLQAARILEADVDRERRLQAEPAHHDHEAGE